MTIVDCDAAGLATVEAALRRGEPVLMSGPSPQPYGVVARAPNTVNIAKKRPAAQHVSVWVTDGVGSVRPHLRLDDRAAAVVSRLLVDELVTLLVPVTMDVPDWLRPATRNGFALLTGGQFAPIIELQRRLQPLYVSSGNRTGQQPAVTSAEADAAFEGDLLVLDCDRHRDATRRQGSTTMLRMSADGDIELVRSGVQDFAVGPESYLGALRRRLQPDDAT